MSFLSRALLIGSLLAAFMVAGCQSSVTDHAMGLVPSHQRHGLGLIPPTGHVRLGAIPHAATLPASVDLSQWAEPVQNQGQVNSCASWSSTALRYWYRFHTTGMRPPILAPMYQYAQIVHGQNVGTSFDDNLNIQQSQGSEPLTSYSFGAYAGQYDYTDQPNTTDRAAATAATITGWQYVSTSGGPQNESVIKNELAAGHPVLIGISVYGNFEQASTAGIIDGSTAGSLYGYHAIVGYAYNATGVVIENQWGTGWARGGWATLTWSFIDQNVFAAVTIGSTNDRVTPPTPLPLPTITPFPTPRPTAAPKPSPTSAPRPQPSPTSNPQPTPAPQHIRLCHHRPVNDPARKALRVRCTSQ